jgi:hypothetical protein
VDEITKFVVAADNMQLVWRMLDLGNRLCGYGEAEDRQISRQRKQLEAAMPAAYRIVDATNQRLLALLIEAARKNSLALFEMVWGELRQQLAMVYLDAVRSAEHSRGVTEMSNDSKLDQAIAMKMANRLKWIDIARRVEPEKDHNQDSWPAFAQGVRREAKRRGIDLPHKPRGRPLGSKKNSTK